MSSIVDVHTHIFPPELAGRRAESRERDLWFGLLYGHPRTGLASAEDLIAEMDANGVQAAVACAFGWVEHALCVQHNDYILAAASRYPGRILPFVAVQPRAGRAAVAEVHRCVALGAVGIGELMPDGQGYAVDDESLVGPVVAAAVESGVPVMTHSSEPLGHEYPGKGTVTPGGIYRLALRFPRARLLCAHWGGGLPFYELMPEVAAALANVYYDTAASPFLYRPAIFSAAITAAGANKILFGTDYPLIGQARSLAYVRRAGLTEDQTQAILGGNAARLLGLEVP
ncbi:MAG: amidohydrolase family protein [Chloroflexota bacterium]